MPVATVNAPLVISPLDAFQKLLSTPAFIGRDNALYGDLEVLREQLHRLDAEAAKLQGGRCNTAQVNSTCRS